ALEDDLHQVRAAEAGPADQQPSEAAQRLAEELEHLAAGPPERQRLVADEGQEIGPLGRTTRARTLRYGRRQPEDPAAAPSRSPPGSIWMCRVVHRPWTPPRKASKPLSHAPSCVASKARRRTRRAPSSRFPPSAADGSPALSFQSPSRPTSSVAASSSRK